MNISFYKYQGTGNDFVILDNRGGDYSTLSAAQIRQMCDRRFGIGADGLMLLNECEGFDFEMKYYNANGSESTMCGNGGRCLVQFASEMGLQKDTYHFTAIDGPHLACFADDGWVNLQMKEVSGMEQTADAVILDTGSPHYVQLVADVQQYPVFAEGAKIRYSERFVKEGINVNFIQKIEGTLWVRTYERGVENETLSCGTGVTAAALATSAAPPGDYVTKIQTPGGGLAVKYHKVSDNHFTDIWLCGPAKFVFKGEVQV